MSHVNKKKSVGAFVDPKDDKKVLRTATRPPVPMSPIDLRWRDDSGEEWVDDTQVPWYAGS